MLPKTRILYVDDDPEWQQIIQDGISALGYELDFASSSKEAMEKLKRKTYHVALLDKRLNENDAANEQGLELAHVIAGINEGTNIIVYTSHGEKADMREAFRNVKVWDFLDKGESLSEIIRAIREAGEKAVLEFNRPIRMPLEILSVKGDALDKFLTGIPIGSPRARQGLETFAKQLLGKYRPLLADQSAAKLLPVNQKPILQLRFWSKMLGTPIAGWFGNYDDLQMSLPGIESSKTAKESFGISHKLDELVKSDSLPTIGGVVFELGHVDLDEFESQVKFSAY